MQPGYTELDDEFRVMVSGKNIAAEILQRIREENALKVLDATKRLAVAAKARGEARFIQDGDGGGYVDFMMSPVVYHAFGRKWGYDALRDKGFVQDCVKHGSAIRPRSRNAKCVVGFTAALAGSGSAVVAKQGSRFSKTFN